MRRVQIDTKRFRLGVCAFHGHNGIYAAVNNIQYEYGYLVKKNNIIKIENIDRISYASNLNNCY